MCQGWQKYGLRNRTWLVPSVRNGRFEPTTFCRAIHLSNKLGCLETNSYHLFLLIAPWWSRSQGLSKLIVILIKSKCTYVTDIGHRRQSRVSVVRWLRATDIALTNTIIIIIFLLSSLFLEIVKARINNTHVFESLNLTQTKEVQYSSAFYTRNTDRPPNNEKNLS